jgi:hypothetical protein
MVYTHPSGAFLRGDDSRLSEIVRMPSQRTSGTTGQKKDTQTTTLTGAQEESSASQAATSSGNLPSPALGQIIRNSRSTYQTTPKKRKEPETSDSDSGSDQSVSSAGPVPSPHLARRKEPVASGFGSGQPISSAPPPGPRAFPTPYKGKGSASFVERLHGQDTDFHSILVFLRSLLNYLAWSHWQGP